MSKMKSLESSVPGTQRTEPGQAKNKMEDDNAHDGRTINILRMLRALEAGVLGVLVVSQSNGDGQQQAMAPESPLPSSSPSHVFPSQTGQEINHVAVQEMDFADFYPNIMMQDTEKWAESQEIIST